MKNKTLGSKLFIIFLAVVGLLSTIACGMFTIKAANYDNSPDDWREIESTFIEYKNFKNIFVKQKQLIIDAYNTQISKISREGLKAKNNSLGLQFNRHYFEDSVNAQENIKPLRSSQQLKAIDNVNKNVNKKINKIKDFYNNRINSIYKQLKNNKNVQFASLYENKRPPDNVNFNETDFNEVGATLVKNIPGYSIGCQWFIAGGYLVMAVFTITLAIIWYRNC